MQCVQVFGNSGVIGLVIVRRQVASHAIELPSENRFDNAGLFVER
uniref:Uncharacterized protein n=1 Tax=Candidatus Kentrum sp. FW TaxID=2126338 RepID=A0A450TR50_9GAMM|nr:MAG: hypothetical protein BECKFW1821C_GA0114237_102419 [Candidatus Kentron sp. FW]